MSSVYQINKGINKPVEFRGLKAQYIVVEKKPSNAVE